MPGPPTVGPLSSSTSPNCVAGATITPNSSENTYGFVKARVITTLTLVGVGTAAGTAVVGVVDVVGTGTTVVVVVGIGRGLGRVWADAPDNMLRLIAPAATNADTTRFERFM
jgi:hypothetical protein